MAKVEVEKRRELVAQLKLEGLTIREIAADLFEVHGISRKKKVKGVVEFVPYSESTVKKDLSILKEKWRESALEDTVALRGEQLATLRHIRRQAMLDKDWSIALRTVESEMKLTGTAKTSEHELLEDIPVIWTDPLTDDDEIGIGANELSAVDS